MIRTDRIRAGPEGPALFISRNSQDYKPLTLETETTDVAPDALTAAVEP